MITGTQHPNSVQISLMRLFDRPMPPEELDKVHQLLMEYYSELIATEADDIIARKGYTKTDFDKVLNESERTRH